MLNLNIYILNHVCTAVIHVIYMYNMLQKILTKKNMGPGNSDFCHVKNVMENVMEKSWNFVLENLYEPCCENVVPSKVEIIVISHQFSDS